MIEKIGDTGGKSGLHVNDMDRVELPRIPTKKKYQSWGWQSLRRPRSNEVFENGDFLKNDAAEMWLGPDMHSFRSANLSAYFPKYM